MTSPSLTERLAALAAETPQFNGTARQLDTADPFLALLDEIDTTVLSAALEFATEKSSLRLLVTGRRLHMILDGAPDDLLNTPLSPDDAQLIERTAQLLADFAEGATTLQVTHSAPPKDASDTPDRVSARALAAAYGLVDDDPDAPVQERFTSRMGDTILAAIHLTDRAADDITGAAAEIAALKIALTTQLSRFLEARTETCASHSDPSLTLWSDVNAPGVSIGLAVFGAPAILFALPTSEIGKATAAFRQVT